MSEEENPGTRGAHQLPGNVSAAAILSHVKLNFQSQALPVEEAMEAVLSGEAAPSGASQSSAPHVHWGDEMTRDMDGNIMPSSTPPPGQMAPVSNSFNDDNDDVAGSPMSVSGEDVHDRNSQPLAGGQSGVPRDQPGGTANLGHSLRGTQPTGSQGNAALAAKDDRRNPLLNRGWEDVASRMAVITLPAAGRHTTPKAGTSTGTPRSAHSGVKPPATTPKMGRASSTGHPPTLLTPEGAGG